MPRVAIGGVWHETNTFAAATTPLADFEIHQGDALVEAFRGTRTPLGGFIDGAREHGFEIVPALFASAVPSGTVTRAAYEATAGPLAEGLAAARPAAVLLDLHGAMVVEGCEAVEADQIARIRQRLGKIPIGAVLDFHANLEPSLIEQIDLLAGYNTYPHVDPYDRAVEVVGLLARALAGKIHPTRALAQPPLLTVPQAQKTDAPPMRGLMEMAREAEREPGVLGVTVAGGFAYADVPHSGIGVAATTNGDLALARRVADRIARAAWDLRDAFRVTNPSPQEAVAKALLEPEGPVVLVDQADNIGGGSPGDGTALLSALLEASAAGAVVSIADPEAVALARSAGVGATLDFMLGGKVDRLHGPTLRVRARVSRLGSGDFSYEGSYMTHRRVKAGDVAVLEADGVTILVRERKVMPFDRREIEVMGIDPAKCRIIVVKSALAWRAAYGELARAVIEVDTPGICTARLQTLSYRRVRRPIVPLDPVEAW
jgi:microcystin degradation protein MlrC